MRIGSRHYASSTVDWLRAMLAAGECTRHFLARGLCEREDWRNAKGDLCLASGRAVLPALSEAVGLPLPDARPLGGISAESRLPAADYPDKELICALAGLGEVEVVLVADEDKAEARAMLLTHHPKGDARSPGGRLRYWIRSSVHGVLGGFTVGAASWHCKARDLHIGWSQAAWDANLGLALCQDRFLLLPGVCVHGLASHALSLLCGRVAGDWEERYGLRPQLIYSFVGSGYSGFSYRAAGWERCKEPEEKKGGRKANGGGKRKSPKGENEKKKPLRVYAAPLAEDWRETLCRKPERAVGAGRPSEAGEDAQWEEIEYGRSGHSDARAADRDGRRLARPSGSAAAGDFPRRGRAEGGLQVPLQSEDRHGRHS